MPTRWWPTAVTLLVLSGSVATAQRSSRVIANDVHFHLTNYVQRGPELREFVRLLGDSIGRVALFGIPLQQEWLASVTGTHAPTYYLHSDAPLYYYSFTDAAIAMAYKSLSKEQQVDSIP